MFDAFYQQSDIVVFFIMVSLTVGLSLLFILFHKYFLFHKLHFEDNATTASVASLIGIVYGVLAGFVCLYLLTNQDHASSAALDEGVAAANIYRDSHWLNNPLQSQLQNDLKQYITTVINVEWPEMSSGKELDIKNGYLIDKISSSLMAYPANSQKDIFLVNDLMQEVKALFKGRQERIAMSQTELSPEIWDVILLCTILIIIINYAFKVNFYLHVFVMTAFATMAASILFLLITLDRPFQGEFIVEPQALQAVLDMMAHEGK